MIDRRSLLGAATLAPFLALGRAAAQTPGLSIEEARARAAAGREALAAQRGVTLMGEERIAMLVYPGFTALDLVGPHYFLASLLGAEIHLVTTQADLSPVASDLILAIAPTVTMADAPEEVDLLFVPGGSRGAVEAMRDAAVLDFIRSRAATAGTVASVCTGSMLLGAAGLLRGRRATSHWAVRHVLAEFGAEPVDARIVTDGNILTGAGVSAGLDLGLALAAALRGPGYAEGLRLQAEYAPDPPVPGGTPETTSPEIARALADIFAPLTAATEAAARG